MTSIFTRIIEGEIPGRIIWRDDTAVAMVDIRPLSRGHTLVIPITETDQWTDLPAAVAAHLFTVAHHVANAQKVVGGYARIGIVVAGFEVPHAHVHVVPMNTMSDLDFATADQTPDPNDLDAAADELRNALRSAGHAQVC
ncbi:MAG: HIT family protein [Acidimicrobiales bacterium]